MFAYQYPLSLLFQPFFAEQQEVPLQHDNEINPPSIFQIYFSHCHFIGNLTDDFLKDDTYAVSIHCFSMQSASYDTQGILAHHCRSSMNRLFPLLFKRKASASYNIQFFHLKGEMHTYHWKKNRGGIYADKKIMRTKPYLHERGEGCCNLSPK